MDLKVERQDGILTASPEGRIDGSNVAEFEQAIRTAIEDDDRALIMNCENLVYISSAGLRAFLLIAKSQWGRDAKFAISSLTEPIQEVFEISGFDKIISVHPSMSEALAYIGS